MLKILFLITYLVCLPALARGYEAKYDMLWSVGLKLEAEATETLKKMATAIKLFRRQSEYWFC